MAHFTISALATLFQALPQASLGSLPFELLQEIAQHLLDNQPSALNFAAANSVTCQATFFCTPFVDLFCTVNLTSPPILDKIFEIFGEKLLLAPSVASIQFSRLDSGPSGEASALQAANLNFTYFCTIIDLFPNIRLVTTTNISWVSNDPLPRNIHN
ncbi:uncharacterized protein PHACADRAFT_30211 [Phanerochaete carnosa HHB-10118-sp]|uniref:F-box domain-containing protein n=1 Tax=Phanerochaete carnosa (strain HHB-10118-sp) TaxID=650164 RepID=K5W229_PHACS|nr:uncharacterized protein PHACADRAFT_30211 [Phanerochaete carnosa HHB-10118-sp]EKM53175.1 hypothetical protein PHACADRAFT_30211 [Phanerochaete carnosa HHB-10118-sp]